ncbi:MAG: xanthine permease [Anaerolineae bacterium]|nr:xanthine permease [Anaerolineae bacterium]
MASSKVYGYLPNDAPEYGKMAVLGLQHILTMFPATVLVALLCGFHVSTVLFASGVSTIVALVLSKRGIGKFIPLFYGSSFSYIAAYTSIVQAMTGKPPVFGTPAPDNVISTMQAGIIATGLLNILVGFIIKSLGKKVIDNILPPIITGSIACVIGFGLGFAALDMSLTVVKGYWGIALITLVATVGFSYLLQGKGFLGMLPILLGAIVGYIATLIFAPGFIKFDGIAAANIIQAPNITLPSFASPLVGTAIFSIAVMALATIPESTAHLYQMSLYVDQLADDQNRERYHLDRHVGFNLMLDGVGDFLNGLFGATAGTNYGENNSLMAITRNYSGPVLIAAGIIAILLSFIGPFAALVNTVPVFVSGGLAIYLFGVIGMQGIALMQSSKVNLFDPLELAIGAIIMVIGIGGNIGFPGGLLPITVPGIFPQGLPAIATAAVIGIVLNLVFRALRK